MISLLLSLAFGDTTVYAPMESRLETSVVHYFIDKDFHSRKKDMLVINWAECDGLGNRECAMMKVTGIFTLLSSKEMMYIKSIYFFMMRNQELYLNL